MNSHNLLTFLFDTRNATMTRDRCRTALTFMVLAMCFGAKFIDEP